MTEKIALFGAGGKMGVRLTNVESAYDLVVTLFFPWQVLLAFILAHLLKASPRKDAAAT